jgi:hypothetical protein
LSRRRTRLAGEHCAGAFTEGGRHVAHIEREIDDSEWAYWACILSKVQLRPFQK